MRVIIAGSRGIDDYAAVEEAMEVSGLEPTTVLSGGARGVDRLGEKWAFDRGIPLERWPADWDDHGRSAGPIRNRQMAENADALVAVWDGESRGTKHMIDTARSMGLTVAVLDTSRSMWYLPF